jgi:hypothetical protein
MECLTMFLHTKRSYLFLVLLLQGIAPVTFSQNVDTLRLKDYRPVSIYKVPQTKIKKAKYPAIDFHSHDYPKTDAEVDQWVKTMDSAGIAKSIILSYATGARFDSVVDNTAAIKTASRFGAVLIIPAWINQAGRSGQWRNWNVVISRARGEWANWATKAWVNFIRRQHLAGACILTIRV